MALYLELDVTPCCMCSAASCDSTGSTSTWAHPPTWRVMPFHRLPSIVGLIPRSRLIEAFDAGVLSVYTSLV